MATNDERGAIYRDKVQKILAAANVRKSKRKFRSKYRTPLLTLLISTSLSRGFIGRLRGDVTKKNSCRIYGNLEIHKCNGDFHITAQGHGYQKFGEEHLDHDSIHPSPTSILTKK